MRGTRVIPRRKPVRRAGMVGGTAHLAGLGTRHADTRERPQPTWVEELERLRRALTVDEYESAKRHLLAG
jgi:hypothetical protein